MRNRVPASRVANLSLVFAVDENNVLGKDNTIPWTSPHDFNWFKQLTSKSSIMMGRKTWESLPIKPLPNRINYVITTNPDYVAPGAFVVTSLQAAIEHSQKEYERQSMNVIGGKALLEEASAIAGRAYISRIGVKTFVDEHCVMGPALPAYDVHHKYAVNAEGTALIPTVHVEVAVFHSQLDKPVERTPVPAN